MKAVYDELMVKHGGNINKVRRDMPRVNYVIGDLPEYIKEILKTDAESLWLSAENLAKQLHKHSELTPTEYISVFNKIKDCTEIYENGNLRIALIVESERHYVAIL